MSCVHYDGIRNGKWIEFWENGKLFKEMTYVNGLRNGDYKEYDRYGNETLHVIYDHGVIE